jgi:signal peptide peptidase SppA
MMDWLFRRGPRVPVLALRGILSARAGSLNIEASGQLIDAAVRAAKGATLLLDIESPGGSPVQSDLIAARIRRRAEEHGVKVRAVIGEVGASGGYWLACAADEIVANPMSVVGSIGVVGGGFGFPQALTRLGIERRVYTAGENKRRLDPFLPEKPEDVAFVHGLLEDLHARFKDWVRARRSVRLTGDEAAIFDGGFMLADRARALGLVDRFGDLDTEVRAIGGERARPRLFRPRRRGLLGRLPRIMADALLDALEERGRWRLEI